MAEQIIAAQAALRAVSDIGHNIEHDSIGFAVGDGDSSRSELHQYLPVDKDYSDLSYVLGRLPDHFTEVILLGFLGARRDHELFNLGEVHHFLCAAKTPTQVRFERSITAYSTGEWAFEAHSIFSLAVLEPTTVTLAGACKFRLTAPTKIAPLTSLGLSNHGFGVITLVTLGPAFIFTPDCDNDRHDNDGGRRQIPSTPAQSTT